MKKGGIYLHIPFCNHKCHYCDFYTGGIRITNWETYVECLINELLTRIQEINFNPSTLYIGGGTPSLIPSPIFKYLINSIENIIGVKKWDEFTIEVNPEDVDEEKINTWQRAGVNRISMGIQSLNDKELNAIGRKHDSRKAVSSFKLIKNSFENTSIDIMFGLPFQTLNSYKDTLTSILDLNPSHISAYSLMLEEGTALSVLEKKNKISLPDEDIWLKMFDITLRSLTSNGYERYEISNYALPHKKSLHNSGYWNERPYLGLGAGAHSYDGFLIRRSNPNNIKTYIKYFYESQIPSISVNTFFKEEVLSSDEFREEIIMKRLRTTKGLDLNDFKEKFGKKQLTEFENKVFKYIQEGSMKKNGNLLSLTDKGFLLYNSIVSDLL